LKLEDKRNIIAILALLFLGSLVAVTIEESTKHHAEGKTKPPVIQKQSFDCVDCHSKVTPVAVQQWANSKHGQTGVGCMNCHGVDKDSKDGFLHHGARITMVVSPKVCGGCHKDEAAQFAKTAHGKGIPGHEVKLDEDGKPVAAGWPTAQVGRINPDGSAGTCNICHARHSFQTESAKRPETCMGCHAKDGIADGWVRSAHGSFAHNAPLTEGAPPIAPVCVTCHMHAASKNVPFTHDLSSRVTWKKGADGKFAQVEDAAAHRDAMADACSKCHGNTFVDDALLKVDLGFKEGHPHEF
jgi:hypothetical protein